MTDEPIFASDLDRRWFEIAQEAHILREQFPEGGPITWIEDDTFPRLEPKEPTDA